MTVPDQRFFIQTLGCPKNEVDSDKLVGTMLAGGMVRTSIVADADLIVVNTCAFIEAARDESIQTILDLDDARSSDARLVVTGCLAERSGNELAEAMPEIDQVAGFGVPVTLGTKPGTPKMDMLNLRRPPSTRPWAYVKIAEGCDRACGFCAIPSFRGPQRSRSVEDVLIEVTDLGASEIVLVAQDLAAFGRDQGVGERQIETLVTRVAAVVDRVRLLYLYPSDLTDSLIDTICATGVPYFDLSLQHVSRPLMRRMRRWGDGERFLARIEDIRRREPEAALRSNFIVGYPGETEEDHDVLLDFVERAQLDWCGFFAYSPEEGTYAVGLDGQVDTRLVLERLGELSELQDRITAQRSIDLVGRDLEVLFDEAHVARSHREAPEIDGIITTATPHEPGSFATVRVLSATGPDLEAAG